MLLVNQVALIPNAEASVDVTTARTALCNELAFLLPLHSSISEGGMNLSFNYEAAKRYYEQLCILLKRTPTTKAQIRNRSNIW